MATAVLPEFSRLWRLPTAFPSPKANPVPLTLTSPMPLRRRSALPASAAIHSGVGGLNCCVCLAHGSWRDSRDWELRVTAPLKLEEERDGKEGGVRPNVRNKHQACRPRNVRCFAAEGRGFGSQPAKKEKNKNEKNPKEQRRTTSEPSKFLSGDPNSGFQRAPQISSGSQSSGNTVLNQQFMEKLEAVKRSALEQKKAEENKLYQPIDYNTPMESEQKAIGLGTKVGVGLPVVVFGLVFALGDFLPYSSVAPSKDATTGGKEITKEERATLEVSLADYKAALSKSPDDPVALERTVVTLEELGNYDEASSLLEKIIKEKPHTADVYRLLGDVKYELKDYGGSSSAYKNALAASDSIDFDVLRGLTNSLLAAKKPSEAVQVLLTYREQMNKVDPQKEDIDHNENANFDLKIQQIDPIQVDLLLGKAYSDWGHVSDALAVYDQLISKYPNDFRGYLAKGIILKENGSVGDAERMFIQARFFAPEKVKVLVDRYAGK